jgi:hypothetical protein
VGSATILPQGQTRARKPAKETLAGRVDREGGEGWANNARGETGTGRELGTVALSLRHPPARRSIGAFRDAGAVLAHGPCGHRLGRHRRRRQGRGRWGNGGGRAARRHLGGRDDRRASPATAARQGDQGDGNEKLTKCHRNLLCLGNGRPGRRRRPARGPDQVHRGCLPAKKPTAWTAWMPRTEQALSVSEGWQAGRRDWAGTTVSRGAGVSGRGPGGRRAVRGLLAHTRADCSLLHRVASGPFFFR